MNSQQKIAQLRSQLRYDTSITNPTKRSGLDGIQTLQALKYGDRTQWNTPKGSIDHNTIDRSESFRRPLKTIQLRN